MISVATTHEYLSHHFSCSISLEYLSLSELHLILVCHSSRMQPPLSNEIRLLLHASAKAAKAMMKKVIRGRWASGEPHPNFVHIISFGARQFREMMLAPSNPGQRQTTLMSPIARRIPKDTKVSVATLEHCAPTHASYRDHHETSGEMNHNSLYPKTSAEEYMSCFLAAAKRPS